MLRYNDAKIKMLTALSGCLSADRERSATHGTGSKKA